MRRNELIVFDGDDTLWRTQDLYDAVKAEFAELLGQECSTRPDAIGLLDRIDAKAAETRGFTVERFIDSMLETYRYLCPDSVSDRAGSVEPRIRGLAARLLGDYALYDDALAVLQQLAVHYPLVLATKGEPDLQQRKIERLGIAPFFQQVYFLQRKTEMEYRQMLDAWRVAPSDAWAIGNSVRSDINPALRVGMRAIWIVRPTWLYEETSLLPGDVTQVQNLTEACSVILARSTTRKTARGAAPTAG